MSATGSVTGFIDVRDAASVRRIAMARPPLNILTTAMLEEMAEAIESVDAAMGVKAVLLTGEGPRAFCAGVDVADHTAERVGDMMRAFARVAAAILGTPMPIVAALNGAALGGGFEIALACDIVLAREGVSVGQPEIRLGVFPPVAAALLPRLVGRQTALDLILTGRTIRAEEARALGLVTGIYSSDIFETEVDRYMHALAAQSGPVLQLAKRAVNVGAEQPLAQAMHEADRLYMQDLMSLHDPHEGLLAFVEKRAPVWRDA